MKEEEIIEYIKKGGSVFSIIHISRMRDGGTLAIHGPSDRFYSDPNLIGLHNEYPIDESNLITDPLLIKYILQRMTDFIIKQQDELDQNKIRLEILIKNLK